MSLTNEKLSSIISLIVAIAILSASYFQWWNVSWDGEMSTKTWVKVLFALGIILLFLALLLITHVTQYFPCHSHENGNL